MYKLLLLLRLALDSDTQTGQTKATLGCLSVECCEDSRRNFEPLCSLGFFYKSLSNVWIFQFGSLRQLEICLQSLEKILILWIFISDIDLDSMRIDN